MEVMNKILRGKLGLISDGQQKHFILVGVDYLKKSNDVTQGDGDC